jgi:hypothetical protein
VGTVRPAHLESRPELADVGRLARWLIARTEGVTASFLKELLRRAAIYAAEDAAGQGPGAAGDVGDAADGPLTVRDAHMNAALDELLDSRSRLTRALLGGYAAQGPPASHNPVTP